MNLAQLLVWMNFAQQAIPAGVATVAQIKTWLTEAHGKQLPEAELNAALALVTDDSSRRRALAIADATGQTA